MLLHDFTVCHLKALGQDTDTENPTYFYSLYIPGNTAPSADLCPTPHLKLLPRRKKRAIISAPDAPQVDTAENKSRL